MKSSKGYQSLDEEKDTDGQKEIEGTSSSSYQPAIDHPPGEIFHEKGNNFGQLPARSRSTPSLISVHKTKDKSEPEVEGERPGQWPPWLQATVATATLLGGLNVGCTQSIIGPVMPDLALLTGTSTDQVATVLTVRAVASLLATILARYILDVFDIFMILLVALTFQTLGTASAAMIPDLYYIGAMIVITNAFTSTIVTGNTFLVFKLKGSDARTLMQGVVLMLNVGRAITPFIVAPFLAPDPESIPSPFITNSTMANITQNVSSTLQRNPAPEESNVQFAFIAISATNIPVWCIHVVLLLATGSHCWSRRIDQETRKQKRKTGLSFREMYKLGRMGQLFTTLRVFIGLFFMVIIAAGLDGADTSLLMTFVTEYLKWPKNAGITITAIYMSIKSMGCATMLFASRWFAPANILIFDLAMMLVGSAFMTANVITNWGSITLCVFMAFFGYGVSTVYSSLFGWINDTFPVDSSVAALFNLSHAVGMMTIPKLTSHMLLVYGNLAYPAILLTGSILSIILYIILHLLMSDACIEDLNNVDTTLSCTVSYSESDRLIKSVKTGHKSGRRSL